MKFTIDTEQHKITVEQEVSLKELTDTLKKMLGKDFDKYEISVKTEIHEIDKTIPYTPTPYPYYPPYKTEKFWWEYRDDTTTGTRYLYLSDNPTFTEIENTNQAIDSSVSGDTYEINENNDCWDINSVKPGICLTID